MIATPVKSKVTRIGLDIGADSVRAVQLVRARDTYTVRAVSRSERTATESEAGQTPPDRRIYACIRGAEFRGRDVNACVGAGDVEYHLLELPKAVLTQGGDACDHAIGWEVAALMNEPPENIEARHWTLPPSTTPGPNVLAVAARRDAVTGLVDSCRRAGLTCTGLDSAATALCRFGWLLNGWPGRCVWGVLDLGATQARLVLCVDDVPVLVRAVGTGGAAWTQRIGEALRISPKTAEVHKREHGIALQGRGLRNDDAGDVPNPELGAILLGALRSELNELAAETQRSYQYVLRCYAGRQPADLVLVGGGAGMSNLPTYLSSTLGIEVRRAADYLQTDSSRLKYRSGLADGVESLALAIGLAVGG